MKVYMDYSDVVGNLVLLLNRNKVDMEHIPFSLVDKYIVLLAEKFKENKLEFYFRIGEFEEEMFYEYNKDYFIKNTNNNTIDIIKEPSVEYLYEKFRVNLSFTSYDVLDDDFILINLLQDYRESLEEEHKKQMQNINNKILKLVMRKSKEQ